MIKYFKSANGYIPFPIFFPDATRGVVKTLDSKDLKDCSTGGILVNTYHLYKEFGEEVIEKFKGIGNFMNWNGATISDSGGFQVMSLIKSGGNRGYVNDLGINFYISKKNKLLLTPEKSIKYQLLMKTDLIVVLDDFTPQSVSYDDAKISVERTINWAKRCKKYYLDNIKGNNKPYIIGVVQGGKYMDLRKYCCDELVKIGFDGLGYGGWPINDNGEFDYGIAKLIADNAPRNYLLYGLGIGKPNEIVNLVKMGYNIFDCVLPTRDARHKRLYIYKAKSIGNINLNKNNFYEYYNPDKYVNRLDKKPISTACDCNLCKNYSRSYLYHLFKIRDVSALRLSTIHNLRFYNILMEKLRGSYNGKEK